MFKFLGGIMKKFMRHKSRGKKRLMSVLTASLTLTSMLFSSSLAVINNTSEVKAADSKAITVEYLDRGVTAFNTGNGMIVSWRSLASDSTNTVFKLYRDNSLIYTSNPGEATCYIDTNGNANSKYRVDTYVNNSKKSSDSPVVTSDKNYLEIGLSKPGSDYTPNDASVADVDGDGTYEIILKWDPSNSKDNSQSGKTGNVYIDCYKLDGTRLWRIDLGKNIRAGAHYTQFLVADFDGDGKAEMTCKTADGTVDGKGKVIGDASADYRNSKGYILSGPEYYSLFDGQTGAVLDTVNYTPARGTVKSWGDSYGNRVDRFLGAVMYIDSDHPTAVTCRGYYTRMTATAYDVVNKKLKVRWTFDTNDSANSYAAGNGNHNCMPADVDGDGKQELIFGGLCLDDDGSIKWCTKLGHGDALHVGDFLPDRAGLEVWTCHEEKPYGVSLLDAKTGKTIFHYNASADTGRALAGNIYAGNYGAEFFSTASSDVYNSSGKSIATNRPSVNFLCYWDGDLEDELLDGTKITKYISSSKISTLFSSSEIASNNSTKATPCLCADIFGDWREEVIWQTADGSAIRIYETPYDTDYRITTLMQDPQYRNQVAGQNVGYNQPAHTSFYLGSDASLPTWPNVTVRAKAGSSSSSSSSVSASAIDQSKTYMIQNVNSGLYLEVQNGTAAAGANVDQWGAYGAGNYNTWRVKYGGNGYYYIYSCLGDGNTYLLDVAYNNAANGTNIQIYTDTGSDAQLFKFSKNSDGSYKIYTKASADKSVIEIVNGSTASGANVQEYSMNGYNCQDWRLIEVSN